jgi:integrase
VILVFIIVSVINVRNNSILGEMMFVKECDEKALKDLLRYFERKKYSMDTKQRWREIAVDFINFLEKNGRTVDDVGDLLNSEGKVVARESFGAKEYLDTKTRYEASYLNYLCNVLKRFYIGWEKHFPIPNEEFPKGKGEPNRPMLSSEQLLSIAREAKKLWLERTGIDPNDMIGLRDYSMILISLDCGARRIQIRNLNVEHFDGGKGLLLIPSAKGGRNTERVLSEVTKNVLAYYVEKRKLIETKENAMFIMSDGARVSSSAMNERFREIRIRAGILEKGIGFHAPRRGKTWRLKKGGLTEEEINDAMGWKIGSRMSHIYGQLSQAEVQQKAASVDTFLQGVDEKKEKDEKHS